MKKETASKLWIFARAILFGIIYIGLMLISIFIAVSYHEESHQQIYLSYHIHSTTVYSFLGDGGTTSPNMTEYRKYCNEQCEEQQNWAEIIGYNTMSFIYLTWFITTAVLLFVILRGNGKNEADK